MTRQRRAPRLQQRSWLHRGVQAAALGVLVLGVLAVVPLQRSRLAAGDGPAVGDVRTWGYQLQRARPGEIGRDVDLVVIDYSADGTGPRAFSREDVARFRRRDGHAAPAAANPHDTAKPRLVLAYMSVGEAESYRYYWSPFWSAAVPGWLGPENKDWKRNFAVRFWEPGWQQVIVNARPSALQRLTEFHLHWTKPYLDRIIEAGFDGVYLDRVDAFEAWTGERAGAERDMVDFVKTISAYAKARRPGFLVVPQNGEELLVHSDYVGAIDAVAKEDLLYGLGGDEVRNSDEDVTSTVSFLGRARAAGLPVLAVEYLRDAEQRFEADVRLRELGFVPLFASRQLNLPPPAAASNAAMPGMR